MTTYNYRDFEAFGGAREFVNHRGPEAIIHGPAETGKTITTLHKLLVCATEEEYAGASIVILRKTLTSTYSTVLQTFTNKVLGPDRQRWPCEAYGGEKPQWFDFPYRDKPSSRIWVAGLDKSSRLLSGEHDIIYVNQAEELALDEWETLTTRTTGRAGNMPYSQTIGDANPSYPSHWMYHRESLRLFYSRHEENPMLFDQDTGEITDQGVHTIAVLDALTGVRKERLRYGRPARAEGVVYDDYDESVHLIYEDKLPSHVAFYVGAQDWGYSKPGCFGAWAVDGDGRMYLVAQIYQRGRKCAWWAEKAAELQEELGRKFQAVACDPSEPEFIAAFREHGLNAVPAFNRVRPGIDAVAERLKVAGDKRARLFVVRDCLRYGADEELKEARLPYTVEQEFPAYVWADRKAKEEPVKENDHGMDMTRYAVCYVDGLGEKKKRTVRVFGSG